MYWNCSKRCNWRPCKTGENNIDHPAKAPDFYCTYFSLKFGWKGKGLYFCCPSIRKFFRRGAWVAERAGLLNRCTGLNLYRGFESLPLRPQVFRSGCSVARLSRLVWDQEVVCSNHTIPTNMGSPGNAGAFLCSVENLFSKAEIKKPGPLVQRRASPVCQSSPGDQRS